MKYKESEKIPSAKVGILDNNSAWLYIPKSHLMECAGYSAAMEIIERYKLNEQSKVLILCGTGNNGGDGFVIARHLSSFGIHTRVALLGGTHKISTREANLNWRIISENLTYSIKTDILKDSTDVVQYGILLDKEHDYRIIIDALLGTGIRGKIREPIATAIDFINEAREHQDIKIVSIDVPSGLNPDTGEVEDKAVKSDLVITFHRAKTGMKIDEDYIRHISVKSIGIPPEAHLFVGRGDFLPTMKQRMPEYHKGQFGRMLVIGGSKNYSGAPAYSSLTGINFGIDLIITYVPNVVADVIRTYSPNLIVRSQQGNWLNSSAIEEVEWLVDWANAILVGPGLGQEEESEDFLVSLLETFRKMEKSFVLDADALKLVSNHLDLLENQSVILTPHSGELAIMTGTELKPYTNIDENCEILSELAEDLKVTLLVKGPYDIITNGMETRVNRTGCAEMTVGGTGDVLAGLCTSFLGIENDPFDSACSAAFLNGLLGEYCKKNYNSRFNAMNMIDNIGKVISLITQQEKTPF